MSTNQNYVINFTRSTLSPIVLQPLKTDGPVFPTDPTVDPDASSASTSLLFFGKGHPGYGERMQENLLHLLENFAGPVAPEYPVEGQFWYDTINGLKIWTGSSWSAVTGSGSFVLKTGDTMAGTLVFPSGTKIVLVDTPVLPTDAANKAYVDLRLLKSGDSMTGFLTLNADPTSPLHAATKQYVDSLLASGIQTFTKTNNDSVTLIRGMPVYIHSMGYVRRAMANSSILARVVGIVEAANIAVATSGTVQSQGMISASTAEWDAVTGLVGGLTEGSVYYLDPSVSGKITTTAPVTPGQYVVRLGVAISSTQLDLGISDPILL